MFSLAPAPHAHSSEEIKKHVHIPVATVARINEPWIAEELIANARETALGRKHVVMLAHDIVHSTALCLNDLIDQFPEYRMEPLTPEVAPVQFHP